MHLTVTVVVAYLIAIVAQATRILPATKPFWGRLPAVVQVWLPPLVPALAAFGSALTGVTTWTDLIVALFGCAALIVPGAPSNRSAAPLQAAKPFVPPMPVLMLALGLLTLFVLPGCSLFGANGPLWPVVQQCAPSPASLLSQVETILLAGGDYESDLLKLAQTAGKDAVVCAVKALVPELQGKVGASPAAARGKAFLVKTDNAS